MLPLGQLRKQIPLLEEIVYLDSASVSPAPMRVVDAMTRYYHEIPFNYGVGVFRGSKEAARQVDEARGLIARFINANAPEEVVFTKNTTEAINLVATGLDFAPGDEIILSALEHQSNLMPWQRVAKEQGVKLKLIKPDPDGRVAPIAFEKHLSDRTRLVTITHVSNVMGTIQPVEAIGKVLSNREVPFLVDAAQSGGRIPIDVRAMGCDFATFCGRKGFSGPQGTGFLWAKKERLKSLQPLIVGSRAGNVEDLNSFSLNPAPHRFEAGVLNTAGVIGLGAAVRLLEEVGVDRILNHNRELTQLLLSGLAKVRSLRVLGPQTVDHQAGILSFSIEGMSPSEVAKSLDDWGRVAVASGHQGSPLVAKHLGTEGVVRVSVHYFNNEEDVAKFLEAMRELIKMARP